MIYELDGKWGVLRRRRDEAKLFEGEVSTDFKPKRGTVYVEIDGVECKSEYIDLKEEIINDVTLKRVEDGTVVYKGSLQAILDLSHVTIDCFGFGTVFLHDSIKGFFVNSKRIETGVRMRRKEDLLGNVTETVERGRFVDGILVYGFTSKKDVMQIGDKNGNRWMVEEENGVYRKTKMEGNIYESGKRIWCFGEDGSSDREYCTVLDEEDEIDISENKVTIRRQGNVECKEEYTFRKVKVRFAPNWMVLCSEEPVHKEQLNCREEPVHMDPSSVMICEQKFEREQISCCTMESDLTKQESKAGLTRRESMPLELSVPSEPPRPSYSINKKNQPVQPSKAVMVPVIPPPNPPQPVEDDAPTVFADMWDEVVRLQAQFQEDGNTFFLERRLQQYQSRQDAVSATMAETIQGILNGEWY